MPWASVEQRPRRIPGGPVTCVRTTASNGRERFEDNAIGERRGDVGMVVGRTDLDDIHPDDGQLRQMRRTESSS